MRKLTLLMVPALLAPTLLTGCQTWGPTWSEITGARYNVTVVNRRPAIIDRVDDQGAFPNPNLIKVAPGEHRLVVQGPGARMGRRSAAACDDANVAPCKRYYINAQFANTIGQEWTPVVDYVEPIGDCMVPGAKTAAK